MFNNGFISSTTEGEEGYACTIQLNNLTYKFYTKPWPRIYGLCGKKTKVTAGSQAAHTQSLAHEQCR